MTGRDKFKRFKPIISFFLKISSLFPTRFNKLIFRIVKNFKGNIGVLIRYILLKTLCESCGDNVYIDHGVEIKNIEKLSIGNNVSIHQMSYLDAIGGIQIGNNVSIAHSCSLVSFNHGWENTELPIKYNELKMEQIRIDDDVWIACGVRVLSGAKMSTRTIVAANAVVSKGEYEKNVILGGIPATVIKKTEK